jgi:hypothetical protein
MRAKTDVRTVKDESAPKAGGKMKRAFCRRDQAEAHAEVTVEDGVRVTRLPEVMTGKRI